MCSHKKRKPWLSVFESLITYNLSANHKIVNDFFLFLIFQWVYESGRGKGERKSERVTIANSYFYEPITSRLMPHTKIVYAGFVYS